MQIDDDADQIREKQQAKRDVNADKLAERTRTASLGALAILWGIFSEKKTDDALCVSPHSRVALLGVAFAAIVTLSLDFAEYLFGYLHRRELAGDAAASATPYQGWEAWMRGLKLVCGALTVVALCIVLACILVTSLHCQTSMDLINLYKGTWCGGLHRDGTYRCFRVLAPPENEFAVQLSYQGRKGWITCGEVKFDDINLKAMCGLGTIDVSPKVPGLLLNLELIIPDYYKGSVDLKKQDE